MNNLSTEYTIETSLWSKQIKAEIPVQTTGKSLKNQQNIELRRIYCFDPFDLQNAIIEIKQKKEKLINNRNIDHINRIITLSPFQLILTYNSAPLMSTTIVKKTENYTYQQIVDFSYQIISALSEMHENDIIHGNLDLKQIVITENGVKLRGFNLNSTTNPVDKSWSDKVAPEILKDCSFETKCSNIYSAGCCIIEMMTLKTFHYHTFKKLISKLTYKEEFINLILSMIELNPKKRPETKFILQKLKSFKPRILYYTIGESIFNQDILINISKFLTPQEFTKTIMFVNKMFRSTSSFDGIWKYYFDKYTYYPKNVSPLEYNVDDFRRFFLLKPWTFKQGLKGFRLSKSRNTIENITKPFISPLDIKVCCSEESLTSGKFLTRVLYEERIPKCFVGVISSKNLDLALKEIDREHCRYVKYFRDGSVSIHQEKGEKRKFIQKTDGFFTVFQYKVRQNDVLSVLVDIENASIKFWVNNEDSQTTIIENVKELKYKKNVYLVFGMPFNQKFTILSNLRSDSDPKLKRVSFTEKSWSSETKKKFSDQLKKEDNQPE
eukprot:gene5919-9749_t